MSFQSPAIVIGCSGSVGRVVTEQLHKSGVYVLGVGRTQQPGISEFCDDFLRIDITHPGSVQRLFNRSVNTCGLPKVIIYTAGKYCSNQSPTQAEESAIFNTNYKAFAHILDIFSSEMGYNGGGKFVALGSVAAFRGSRCLAYAQSKAALHKLLEDRCEALARINITLNIVCPGPILNDFFLNSCDEERRRKYLDSIPMGRFASPDEIAFTTLCLTAQESGYVTGSIVKASGGLL